MGGGKDSGKRGGEWQEGRVGGRGGMESGRGCRWRRGGEWEEGRDGEWEGV